MAKAFTAFLLSALTALAPACAQSLEYAGSAVRSEFFVDLYRISIWDEDGNLTRSDLSASERPLEVQLDVLYGGDMPDIPKEWSSELVPVLPGQEMTDLREGYRNLSEGDRIILTYRPEQGTVIRRNGQLLVNEPGYTTTRATLDIWFGDRPASDSIKQAFLGGS